jgi:hypothetical protein
VQVQDDSDDSEASKLDGIREIRPAPDWRHWAAHNAKRSETGQEPFSWPVRRLVSRGEWSDKKGLSPLGPIRGE